jgi:hypothetical protein
MYEQLLENLRGKDSEPWSTEMTVWQVPLVAIPPQTSWVLLTVACPSRLLSLVCKILTPLVARSPSLAVKHDEVIAIDSGRGRVEAHKSLAVLREREISLATALEDEVYARCWCIV